MCIYFFLFVSSNFSYIFLLHFFQFVSLWCWTVFSSLQFSSGTTHLTFCVSSSIPLVCASFSFQWSFPSGTKHRRLIFSPDTSFLSISIACTYSISISISPPHFFPRPLHRRGYVKGNGLWRLGAEVRLLSVFLCLVSFLPLLLSYLPILLQSRQCSWWAEHPLSLAAVPGN